MKILSKWGLPILIICYVALALVTSQTLHFSRALDEGYHLDYVTFIKQTGRLPINYEERAQLTRADFPPLYQLLVAGFTAPLAIDAAPDFKYFWDASQYRAVDHQMEDPWTLATEDLQWPYFGRFAVWQMGRLLSVLLSACTLVVVYFTLQEIPLGYKPLTSLAGAAVLAFIPRYLFLGSALNDDNLLGLVAALYFWMLVKVVKYPLKWWPYIALGSLLGISITVKYTLILVPLEILLVCGLIANHKKLGWLWLFKRLLVVAAPAVLLTSWWFGWNIWYMNTIEDDGLFVGIIRPILSGGSDTTLNRLGGFVSGGQAGITARPTDTSVGSFFAWLKVTFFTFWEFSVPHGVPFSPVIYLGIGAILLLAAYGLWRLWQRDPTSHAWLLLLALHVAIFLVLPLVRFILTRRLGAAAQGRHILVPAATALVGLLLFGLWAALPRRWHNLVIALLVAGLLGWSGMHIYHLVAFSNAPLPVRSITQAAEWLPNKANVQFGNGIELVSYAATADEAQGVLQVQLAWRSLEAVKENYLVQLQLLDSAGQVVSHWLGYNGAGRYPTLAWSAGDTVFDRLQLPLSGLEPGNYQLQLRLLGANGLPVAGLGPETPLKLTDIVLTASGMFDYPHSVTLSDGAGSQFDIPFALWPLDNGAAETVRYPGTVLVITADSVEAGQLEVQLIDDAGQSWPPSAYNGNIYAFIVGPRWQSGNYKTQFKLLEEDGSGNSVRSDDLIPIENWWPRQFAIPEIEHPLEVNFADQINLLGYYLPNHQVKAGDKLPLTLYWQAPATRSPQADFIQFNNLLDSNGTLSGGYDRLPLEYYSTLLWAPGEVVVDGYAVPVNANASPGEYYLDIGLYLTVGESAVNLPLVNEGKMSDITSVTIGPITVTE